MEARSFLQGSFSQQIAGSPVGGATMKEITAFNSQVTDPQFQELFFPRTILLNKVVKSESYESLTKTQTHQTSLRIEEPSTLHNEAQLNPFLSTISRKWQSYKATLPKVTTRFLEIYLTLLIFYVYKIKTLTLKHH